MAEYRALDEHTLPCAIASLPEMPALLGGSPDSWQVQEIGDGNLNLVFRVQGSRTAVIAKQALPYVRMVGESWPLPLSRSHFEYLALGEHHRLCPGLVPRVLGRDATLALTVMEYLGAHVTMRRSLVAGETCAAFSDALSTFLSRTLFFGSDLALRAAAKKSRVAQFAANTAMCKITEDLVFTEPYMAAAQNRWTSPHLDGVVAQLRQDTALKLAAARLKHAFLSRTETLLHGDLHTGSIMVSQDDVRIIDSEFACYGPMAFDVGMLIGNLLLSAFAQPGLEAAPGERDAQILWLLGSTQALWQLFCEKFLDLWRCSGSGDAFAGELFTDATGRQGLEEERLAFMGQLYGDALGFAGLEMIRRLTGLAHVLDFEAIEDPLLRAQGEMRALQFARHLLLNRHASLGMGQVVRYAAEVLRDKPDAAVLQAMSASKAACNGSRAMSTQ